jgi:hypothetical protein
MGAQLGERALELLDAELVSVHHGLRPDRPPEPERLAEAHANRSASQPDLVLVGLGGPTGPRRVERSPDRAHEVRRLVEALGEMEQLVGRRRP